MDLETIISIVGTLVSGGVISSIVTWKYARKKAEAEAQQAEAGVKQAEAEALKADAEAQQERQNYYQQLIDDMAKDRDYYKAERDELRAKIDKVMHAVSEWKEISEQERLNMKRDISDLRRQIEAAGPLLCGRTDCADRIKVEDTCQARIRRSRQLPERTASNIEPVESDVI